MSALLRAKGGVNGQNNGGSNNGIGNTGGGYNGNNNGVGNKAFDRNDPELERIMKTHPANPDTEANRQLTVLIQPSTITINPSIRSTKTEVGIATAKTT